MRFLLVISMTLCMVGCTVQKGLEIKPKIIAYKLPFKVEQLLLKQIEEQPKDNYCLLLEGTDNLIKIYLVKSYSYYHKNTSYNALIGEKYYPISFPQFDMKYGVVTDAEEFLGYKIKNPKAWDNFGKQSYPMYHGMYKIELDLQNNIVFEGYVY